MSDIYNLSADEALKRIKNKQAPDDIYSMSAEDALNYARSQTKDIPNLEGTTGFYPGLKSSLERGYAGITQPFAEQLPEQLKPKSISQLAREEEELAGFGAGAGQFAGEAIKSLPLAAIPGTGLPAAAARIAGSAGLSALYEPEDRAKAAIFGGVGGMAGEAIGAGLSRMVKHPFGQATPEAREFVSGGGEPSWAQTIGSGREATVGGKALKRFEETMSSSPVIGPNIDVHQLKSMESFNKSTLQQIVDDLNKGVETTSDLAIAEGRSTVPKKLIDIEIEPGAAGFKHVKSEISDAYNRIVENTSAQMTPAFSDAANNIRELAKAVPDKEEQINRLIDDVLSKFSADKRTPGEVLKGLDKQLGDMADRYGKKGGDDSYVADAATELRSQLHDLIGSQDPYAKQALENANRAWFKIKRMEQAMTSSVSNELASPANLLQALRGKNRAQYATGDMPLYDWARSAEETIGNRYPDPGTAGRLEAKDLLAAGVAGFPLAAGAYYGSKTFYNPAVQRWLVEQTFKQPGLARLIAADVAKRGSLVGGAAISSTSNR